MKSANSAAECSCMVAGFAMADGQSVDHIAVGTRAGDCLFVDVRSGDVTVYFPAHRYNCVNALLLPQLLPVS